MFCFISLNLERTRKSTPLLISFNTGTTFYTTLTWTYTDCTIMFLTEGTSLSEIHLITAVEFIH